MADVLCLFYSRTGTTRRVMNDIAGELQAECVEITDGLDRTGTLGYFLCGMDAVRHVTRPLKPYETERPLGDYKLVLLGTPVWAGRCSSIMRGLLKRRGLELSRVGYVVTCGGDPTKQEAVFRQMDLYTAAPRMAEVSLRYGDSGYHFALDAFLTRVRAALDEIGEVAPGDGEVIEFVPPVAEKSPPKRRRAAKIKKEEDHV